MADSLLAKVTDKLVDCLYDAVKNQVNYLCCYSCNVQTLADEVPALESKKWSVEQDVNAARQKLDVIRPDVLFWLSETEHVLTKSKKILEDATQVHERCLSKWCPVLHYKLSKEAKETTEKSIKLISNSSFERISNPVNPEEIDPIPAVSEFGLMSRDSIENQIMDALKDERVYLIGLYGMGGVGKTTMAKKIEKRAHEARKAPGSIFKHVILAVVSLEPDLPKIQQEIAEGMGFKLEQESTRIRAKLLHQRLTDENGVLIILDDVWKRLNLEDLGIPSQSTNPMCKLILTSRYKDALTLTGSAKIIQLDVLTDEESWILFRNNAGDQVDSPDLHQIAKGVVGECKGLPLALVTVGLALRDKNKSYWEGALKELRKSIPSNISDVLKRVYRPLLWSVNRLESKEARYLFLLCCLFPEDSIISIDALIRYGMGLKIFMQIKEARSQVELILSNLISSSLLIDARDSWGNLNVKMHDVIRDVGIFSASVSEEETESENKIVSMEKHVFKISHGMEKWPTEDTYGNHTCISLTFSPREPIVSDCINCPMLELLHIDGKTVLPENFFNGMTGLKVLEASRIGSLPSSIQVLKNLRTLHLSNCELEKISVIGLGELMNLEILSFNFCQIMVLPKEIGGLKKLRKLDITWCRDLGTVAFGVVSGLVRLEELVMMESFRDWEAHGNDDEMINNASLVELDSLSHLTTLQIEVSSPNAIPRRIPHWVQRLEKYYIRIASSSSLGYESLRVKFQKIIILNVQEETRFGDWFYRMAKDADYLDLKGSNCTYVINNLNRTGYQNLKHFSLDDFTNIQYLCEGQYTGAVFPVLKHLFIKYSDSLQMIINGSLPTRTFEALEEITLYGLPSLVCIWANPSENLCLSNLEIVKISGCTSLLYLFPLSTMKRLSQLRELGVEYCPIMKEIFRKEEGGMGIKIKKMEFPKLESLRLSCLGSLYEFCKAVEEIDVPALLNLSIVDNLMEEANDNIHQQYVFDQVGEANNSLQLRIMFSPLTNFNFGTNLQELTIRSIPNVKSVFAPSTLWFFPSLRDLYISYCPALEEVIGKGQENVQQTKSQIFPRLEKLTLYGLPNILTFCSNMGHLELLSLRYLSIGNCPVMKTFDREIDGTTESFFSEKVSCPKLSYLDFKNLDIERIFGQNLIDNFCRLAHLSVLNCPRIKHLFSHTNFRNLQSLKDLYLDNCEKLEEVIGKEDGEEAAATEINKTLSLQLKRLELTGLPKMHTFYSINNHLELPSLQWVKLFHCRKLQRFSLGTLHLPRFIQTEGALEDPHFAAKFFFNKEKSSLEIDLEDNNCFTISARDLTTNDGEKLTPVLEKVSSDTFVALGKPRYSWFVEIRGKLDSIKLSTGVWYEVIFMIMLEDDARGWEASIKLKLTLSGEIIEHHKEILDHKPRGEWIEILVGKFMREDHPIGDLEFSLRRSRKNVFKSGLYVKGVKIQKI